MNNLILLAIICFIAMVSPGPDFILVTRNALLHRRNCGLATALGIVCGCLFHASYCILGLALVIAKSVLLFSLLKTAGGCYLIYLGTKALLSKRTISNPDPPSTPALSARAAFFQGLFCNLLNPKVAVFLLSLFTQFISPDASAFDKAKVASIVVIEAAIYWPLLVLLLQSAVVRRFFGDFKLWIDLTCGVLLLYLGARVVLSRD